MRLSRRGANSFELLAQRGLNLSYETVRSWVLKFGPMVLRRLRQRRPRPRDHWHLDEMVVRIAGKPRYLRRTVDHEGEILDALAQRPPARPPRGRLKSRAPQHRAKMKCRANHLFADGPLRLTDSTSFLIGL